MRRFAVLAVIVVVLAIPSASANAQTTTTSTPPSGPYTCHAKKVNVLFWPDGHPASVQYNFPAFATPHVEVYVGTTTTYVDADYLASFTVQGQPNYSASCAQATQASNLKPIASPKHATTAAVLACRLPTAAVFSVESDATSATMKVTAGSKKSVAEIHLGDGASKATYASKYCKQQPPLVPAP